MRILLFNWRDTKHPKAGGAEIVTMEHAKGWVRAGHYVTWFTAKYESAKKSEVIDGVKIIRTAGSLRVYLAAPFYYFSHRNEFDIVVDEIHGIPFFTPLYVRKPIIAFIHEVAGEIWDYMAGFPFNILGKLLERAYLYVYKNIPFWTDASSSVDDLVSFGISRDHCTEIGCPITNAVVTKLPKKEKKFTCIFVSRVVKMKGIEEVIKAFSFIVKENSDAQLLIVGGGDASYLEKLHLMLREYHIDGQTKFMGRLSEEEKLDLMGRAHFLLHGSVKEGWGLVVLEAASQGTPSIVYRISGLVDAVKDGKTGIVLRYNSPLEMAREALLLYKDSNRYKKMQEEGIRWVKSITWNDAIKQSLQLLTDTLKNIT
jgi:glycosyltransferase involved in cell wall biosynthesis